MFGLSSSDLRRIAWTFVMTAVAYGVAAWTNLVPGQPFDWKGVAVAAIAAGLSAAKNLALADDSNLK
jgi:hypothetical protein